MKNNKPVTISFCALYNSYVIDDKNIKQLQSLFNTGRRSIINNLIKYGFHLRDMTEVQVSKDVRSRLSDTKSIIAKYIAGDTATNIAKEVGTTKKVIMNILKENKCIIRGSYPKVKNEKLLDKDWLMNQYTVLNKSLDKIAGELCVSRMTLQRRLKKLNIAIKSPYEYTVSSLHIHQVIPLLNKYGIKHETSYPITVKTTGRTFDYEVDEYLFDHKIFLEIQGDYWHGYTDRISKVIRKNKARDKRKLDYLTNKYPDHHVVYIRETEVYSGVAEKIIFDISNGIIPTTHLPN